MKNINQGAKYYTYEGETRIVYRVIKITDDEITVRTEDKSRKTIKRATLENMLELMPEALLDLMITTTTMDGKEYDDVYGCVYRTDAIMSSVKTPHIILRQDCYSILKNNPFNEMGTTEYVGDCLTQDFMPNGDKLMSIMLFDSVQFNTTISLYLDDTLDDILGCIPRSAMDKINNTLRGIKSRMNSDAVHIVGYCSSLEELMKDNNFMTCYRSIFNITQVDWPVVLGKESYNSDGDIILNGKQRKKIEDMLRKYISNIHVLKYDQDLDIGSFVAFKHIMISDSSQTIYMIAYQEDGDYPVDDDIARALLRNIK